MHRMPERVLNIDVVLADGTIRLFVDVVDYVVSEGILSVVQTDEKMSYYPLHSVKFFDAYKEDK